MKTWEIWEQMDKNPDKMMGKKFRRTDADVTAEASKSIDGTMGLFIDDCRLTGLTGFDEWKEIKEPVSFMGLMEEVRKRPNTIFDYTNDDVGYCFRGYLRIFLYDIVNHFFNKDIAKIISEGEFYIE